MFKLRLWTYFATAAFQGQDQEIVHQMLSKHEREILKAEGHCGEIEISVFKTTDEYSPGAIFVFSAKNVFTSVVFLIVGDYGSAFMLYYSLRTFVTCAFVKQTFLPYN